MSLSVFELFASLKLDSSEYDKGLDQSESKGESFGKKIMSGLGGAAKVGATAIAGITAATTAVSVAFVKGTSDVAQYGDKIDKMSQKMGISAEAYQEWDAVLQHSGTSIDGMSRGMMTLSRQAEKGAEEFQKLGISQEELASMSQEDLFAKTIEGLQNMEAGTERTALAQKLLGGSAKELGALLNTSAEDTQAMKDRVHELGGVMSDEAVKASAAFQDQLQDMQTAFSGLSRNMLSEFLPAVTDVMGGLTAIFAGDSEGGIGQITEGVKNIANGINEALPTIIETGSQIIVALSEAISQNLPTIIPAVVSGLITVSTGIVAQLPTILESIIQGIIASGPAFVDAGMQLFTMLGEGIQQSVSFLENDGEKILDDVLNTITEKLPEFLDQGVELITNMANGLLKALPKIIEGLGTVIDKLVDFLLTNLPVFLEKGVELIVNLANGLVKALPQIVKAAVSVVQKLLQTILSKLPELINAGFELVGKLVSGLAKALPQVITAALELAKGILDTITHTDWLSLGGNIIKGIIQGLKNLGSTLITAMLDIAKGAFDAVKNFFGIKSPSKKMRDEIGKNIVKGMIKGVDDEKGNAKKSAEELSALYVSAAKKKLESLKANNELSLMEEWAYWLEVQEHTVKGSKAYEEAAKYIGKVKNDIVKNVDSLNKEYQDGVAKIVDDLDKEITKLEDTYNKAVADRKKALMGQFNLFEAVNVKEGKGASELIDNLQGQVTTMGEWTNTMDQLETKIKPMSSDLYAELQGMGMDQLETLKAINEMSEQELGTFIGLYETKALIAEERSKKENEELKKQTDEQIEELKTNAQNQLDTLEKKYKKGIKALGVEAKKEFEKAGKNSVKGMGKGMNEQFDVLEAQMKARAAALVAAVQSALQIHSPSKVFADQVGKFIPLGIAEGFEKGMPKAESGILSSIDEMKSGISGALSMDSAVGSVDGDIRADGSPVVMLLAGIYDAVLGMPDDMKESFGSALLNTTFSVNDREFARLVKAV